MKKGFLLILLVLLTSSNTFSQNIHILGTFKSGDILNLKYLFSTITDTYSPKKIHLFDRNAFLYTHHRSDESPLTDLRLDSALNSIVKTHSSIAQGNPTAIEITQVRNRLVNQKAGEVILYNKEGESDPPLMYTDFSALIEGLKERNRSEGKFVLVLVLNKDKPTVSFTYPESNTTVSTKIVEGFGKGPDSVSSVYVRSNKGYWQKAIGTINWSVEVPMQSGTNIIEAIAIDNYGDSSLVATLYDVIFKEKDPAYIDFIYPNPSSNVVRKCQRGQEYSYHFKIAVDSTINIDQLSFVFEDSIGVRKGGFRVKLLPDDSKMKMFGYNEYCFFASYNISGAANHCSIDSEEDYYYRIEYSGEDRVVLPQRIKIHLTSFSSDSDQNEPCNCE